jgi:hypothetical protein
LEALRQFDTCAIANAIERFGVRLRNQGFTQPGLQCITGGFPTPRIAVIQDLATGPGSGSCVGHVHAAILKAFHCEAVITNGLVRDLPGVGGMRFPMFARGVAVSHSYAHLVDYGAPVEIRAREARLIDVCQSPDFSPEKLLNVIQDDR